MPYFSSDEGEVESLRNQVRQEKLLTSRYAAHPDPRDPDWPGHWVEEGKKQAGDEEEEDAQ